MTIKMMMTCVYYTKKYRTSGFLWLTKFFYFIFNYFIMLPFVAALAVLAVVAVGKVHSSPAKDQFFAAANVHPSPAKEQFFAADVDPSPAKANLHDSQP